MEAKMNNQKIMDTQKELFDAKKSKV